MKVYISGPMTGLPEFNYPAFHAAEAQLRAEGHEVTSPAREGEEGWGWTDFMRRALVDLSDVDAIYLLPFWETSKGARLEGHIAEQLGMVVLP